MPLYEINKDRSEISNLEKTSFEDEELKEREDLQRLLKTHIDVLNPNIMIVAEEFGDWEDSRRSIDLLAIDKAANLVVIELKRTKDGSHMELQAIRYAAMVSNMTWEQVKQTFQKYIDKNKLDENAEEKLYEFLDWDSPKEDEFAQNVRIILASANFSKEITTSVLWLNEHDLDISCVRLSLYKTDDQLVLNAEQIIPIPEAETYQTGVRQKKREERASRTGLRDHSLLSISYSGAPYKEGFKKSDIGHITVKLLDEKGLIDTDVFAFLREDTSCSFGLLKRLEEITETEKRYTRYRFTREPELTHSGETYYIARNWGIDNIDRFIQKIENRFSEIKFAKLEN